MKELDGWKQCGRKYKWKDFRELFNCKCDDWQIYHGYLNKRLNIIIVFVGNLKQ